MGFNQGSMKVTSAGSGVKLALDMAFVGAAVLSGGGQRGSVSSS